MMKLHIIPKNNDASYFIYLLNTRLIKTQGAQTQYNNT